MDNRINNSLTLLSPNPSLEDFNSLFNHLNILISTKQSPILKSPNFPIFKLGNKNLKFASTSISSVPKIENPQKPISRNLLKPSIGDSFQKAPILENPNSELSKFGSNSISLEVQIENPQKPISQNMLNPSIGDSFEKAPILENPNSQVSHFGIKNINFASNTISLEVQTETPQKPTSQNLIKSPKALSILKTLSVFERAFIGAGAGGIAGAFTYVCLHPLDTIKTKLQAKGASQIYNGTFDAFAKTFKEKGILGFYSGVSAVIVGSTASSAVYFGTCEFGKSILSKFPQYPAVLIPPTAGAMGNIISSAIMVPKELITQRMQVGAKGRSWEVLLKILEKDGILGLYAGYSATLLRNLPAGVLSYSSFEYLKAAVLSKTERTSLEPFQSVLCGALAGAISASLTTPLDVVKTRLMTQSMNKASAEVYKGFSSTMSQILTEEGWVGFTRGMGPRVLHSACFSALGYFAFETARLTLLDQYLKRKESGELNAISP